MTPAERRSYTNRVRGKLHRRSRLLTLEMIAADTPLSFGWLKQFSRSAFDKPNVEMMMTLERYLDQYEKRLSA